MNVDLWLVLIWPVIAFFVCTALLGLLKWVWPKLARSIADATYPLRERARVRRASRRAVRRRKRAVRRPTDKNIGRLRLGELSQVLDELSLTQPDRVDEIRGDALSKLFNFKKPE